MNSSSPNFEIKATDLGGRIASLRTKTSVFETPALLPVIHPVRQLIPCREIKAMGYDAVMTNAYTTYRRLSERAAEGIHKIIDYNGSIMTDSGGYQVLEFGSVDISPIEMAKFEESIGSDIAIILDKPTGLNVTKTYAGKTVSQTLSAAALTQESITREDMLWTLPVQGGRYIDLVSKSAKASAELPFECFALGSPVEVMENYDFPLLVRMILASKRFLPAERPFHLFGAGHPLILPLAIALGCDMFDSASYVLYAKQDRYISKSGTVRLDRLEYLACPCPVCSRLKAGELKSLGKEARTAALARHNLFALKAVIEESKQAIWEGRLWEYVKSNSSNHPRAVEAFHLAASLASKRFELGTPMTKDRGIFISDNTDLSRPELQRFREGIKRLDLTRKDVLIVVPETKKKPFLTSDIFRELSKIIPEPEEVLITCLTPNYGLVPSEISDIFPVSQTTTVVTAYPKNDAVLRSKNWKRIDALIPRRKSGGEVDDAGEDWLRHEVKNSRFKGKRLQISRSYRDFKRKISVRYR
ncbi:MAG TPA: tRNA guanosine(15) transglycosylase TgtA [Nitrososphaerales archaeon]|nr:tRNA guanosine(15) transglycosylase TgtA [Nitrososphaerales archaeon]